MKNSLFFLSRYQKVNQAINKSIENTIGTLAIFIGFIGAFASAVFGVVFMTELINKLFFGGIPGGDLALLILIIIGITLGGIGVSFVIYWLCLMIFYLLRYIFTSTYRYITNLHQDIQSNISGIQDITDILNKIDKIRHLYSFLQIYKSIIYHISHSHYAEFAGILEDTLNWTIGILANLRSDLALRLTEQQSILEQAKSEVSTHIHGTTELGRVSELQRQRLDRQIEQFEELQRVLVKI